MSSVALIAPRSEGGVAYIIERLWKGLRRERFPVSKIVISGSPTLFHLKHLPQFQKYDVVIITGSIPPPSHIFARSDVRVVLFVHGFVYHELGNVIGYGRLREKLGAMYSLMLFEMAKKADRVDTYICHSITTCEANKIYNNFILLPQFVFPEELPKRNEVSVQGRFNPKVVTYKSYVNSPRLLREEKLISLMRGVSQKLGRQVDLVIVDPAQREPKKEKWGNLVVYRLPFLPRERFLRLIASSDLYIERCVDEELSLGSIDAGIVGTPVAKLTHPSFVERQDYKDEVLWAASPREFIELVSEYLRDAEDKKPTYSRRFREFLLNKRSWDNVKMSLTNLLRSEL
ncbi:glycosyltransferase [Thermofilum sp.]|uniref:glycosyltransferase n=1 Tax=Thermofilum sp. TaxID=1961369 RepID=UPI0031631907